MTDSSKEPSKGAMRAAQAALDVIDERITFFAYEKENPKSLEIVAEVIDRETKAGEMADLLRRVAKANSAHYIADELAVIVAEAERLLTDLEVKP